MDPETATGPSSAEPGQALAEATPQAEASTPTTPLQVLFRERFESLLPTIQREWPEVARHTLESTRGSLDHVVEVISRQTGTATCVVMELLLVLLHSTGQRASSVAESLKPLEEQLEHLLDELNSTLRPKIEKPVREKPLLALAAAAGVGLILGLLLAPGRRSP
ncbi:MAG: glycine zipper domain-containing protein [Synechococcaceae cyanobacterium]